MRFASEPQSPHNAHRPIRDDEDLDLIFTWPSQAVRAFLGRAARAAGAAPNHLISDHGKQFTSEGFREWCARRGIRQRFGAVGKYGSIAVIERFIRTLKSE